MGEHIDSEACSVHHRQYLKQLESYCLLTITNCTLQWDNDNGHNQYTISMSIILPVAKMVSGTSWLCKQFISLS